MFGKSTPPNGEPPAGPTAAEVARIKGGGRVQFIVAQGEPRTFYLFLNDQFVPQDKVESFSVDIEAPDEQRGGEPTASAILSRYVETASSLRDLQTFELFPCTVEIIARGRRIAVTASERNSLDGVWIDLGFKPDGTGSEVSGAEALRIVISADLLDARLTWVDGETENLQPDA